jgi:hypothetical protein
VVEACVPRLADRPWLGGVGTAVMIVLYLAAAGLFFHELVITPGLRTPPAQLIGTGVVVAALIIAAFVIPRRSTRSSRRAPRAWLVGFVVLVLLAAYVMVNDTWGWLGVALAALGLLAWARHRLRVARADTGFLQRNGTGRGAAIEL